MITGNGTTAKFTRQFYGEVPWLWICDDIQMVDGVPQHDKLFTSIKHLLMSRPYAENVVISSQIQVGTTHRLETLFPEKQFAVMPENYRVVAGNPQRPKYWVYGCRSRNEPVIDARLIHVSPEDAEMVKHATNVWLAMSIQFGKDIAALGEKFGADPQVVAETLKQDPRIGVGAYIAPHGEPSPHLKREVWNLQRLGGGKIIDVLEAQ